MAHQLLNSPSVRIHFELAKAANQGERTLQAKKHPTGHSFNKQGEPNLDQQFALVRIPEMIPKLLVPFLTLTFCSLERLGMRTFNI